MKKKIIAFVFGAAVCGSAAFAQESGFGAKLGLNLANMSGDVEDNSMRTSMHIGAYYNYMVSDKFAIQPELVYSGQGYKSTFETPGGDVDVTWKVDYLNIPIMAKYYLMEALHLHAGPQIGINIGAKSTVEFDGESETEDIEDISGIDFALGFGAGYELPMGLNFNIRYNLGLTNAYSGDGKNADGDDYSIKHGVIQISAGWQF